VGAEIVQHDNVAWLRGRRQDLFDIDEEGIAVHRAVDDAWCRKSCGAQARNKGGGFPVTVPDFADQPFTAWSRPRSRAILVEVPVSPMKTSRSGSSLG
jgi:hypothetical protein